MSPFSIIIDSDRGMSGVSAPLAMEVEAEIARIVGRGHWRVGRLALEALLPGPASIKVPSTVKGSSESKSRSWT
jgi:hypothetical protein